MYFDQKESSLLKHKVVIDGEFDAVSTIRKSFFLIEKLYNKKSTKNRRKKGKIYKTTIFTKLISIFRFNFKINNRRYLNNYQILVFLIVDDVQFLNFFGFFFRLFIDI